MREARASNLSGAAARGLRPLGPEAGSYSDHDLGRTAPLRARTIAGFAPLVAGSLGPGRLDALLQTLYSTNFLRHTKLGWPLPPFTGPEHPAFRPAATGAGRCGRSWLLGVRSCG